MNLELTELQQGLIFNWEKTLNEYTNLCNDPNATENEKRETYIKILKYQTKLDEMNIDYMSIIIHKNQKLQQGLQKNFENVMRTYNSICNNPSAFTEKEIQKVINEVKILKSKLDEVNEKLEQINVQIMNFQEDQTEENSLKK